MSKRMQRDGKPVRLDVSPDPRLHDYVEESSRNVSKSSRTGQYKIIAPRAGKTSDRTVIRHDPSAPSDRKGRR